MQNLLSKKSIIIVTVTVLICLFALTYLAESASVPSQILSPVVGDLEIVSSLEQCTDTKWCLNQYKSGGHVPGGGICQADDTYAWDANLNIPEHDTDDGKPVYAVEQGEVTQTFGDCINAGGSYGQLLIEHKYQDNTWWSGYLHLRDIQVEPSQSVDKDTLLGYISNTSPDQIPNHLHFVVYKGQNSRGELVSFDANIVERSFSPKFQSGDSVQTTENLHMRTEPKINDNVITTVPSGSTGQIVDDEDNGIFADGYCWWHVQFGDDNGWCAEDWLEKVKLSTTQSVFTVVGTVKDADGSLAEDGLEVVVSNESRGGITATTTLGEQESGKYGISFVSTENETVASEGDTIKATVKSEGDVLGTSTYKLTSEDIAKALALVDVTLGFPTEDYIKSFIQRETKTKTIVTVDEQEYAIVTLKKYLDPETLVEYDKETKVYTNTEGNPVSDQEIARKIGIVDYVRQLKRDEIKEKYDYVLARYEYVGQQDIVEWVIELSETIATIPLAVRDATAKNLLKVATETARNEGLKYWQMNTKNELANQAMSDLKNAGDEYFKAWDNLLKNEEIIDYDVAHEIFTNYLRGEFHDETGNFLVYKLYDEKNISEWKFFIEEFKKVATFGVSEEILARTISVDYWSKVESAEAELNYQLYGKAHEATSYTLELSKITYTPGEYKERLAKVEEAITKIYEVITDFLDTVVSFFEYYLGVIFYSPGEIRVYDSQDRITGLVDGEVKEEIPNSLYDDEKKVVVIFSPSDSYHYEVVGTEEGKYGLEVTLGKDGETTTFTATDIPTSANAVHQYSVDWDALKEDEEEAVTVKMDSNGDGTFEETVNTGATYTQKEEHPSWDVNSDGAVNIFDLVLVGKNFGETGDEVAGDVNDDKQVNIFDLVLVGKHFGEKSAPSIKNISLLQQIYDILKTVPNPNQNLKLALKELEKLLTPSETVLLQNYPNPFNPETWIPFELAEHSEVSIIIYNATGRMIRTIRLGELPAGIYVRKARAAYWDGRDSFGEKVSSGVYFYQFQAGEDFTATKKLVILK